MRDALGKVLLSLLAALVFAAVLPAQDFTDADTLRYVDAMQLRMVNYAFDRTLDSRLPSSLKDSVRPNLWELARCTSGKAFRFSTDSRAIAVRYSLLTNMHMAHMADTGIKGTSLYIWDERARAWRFVNCNRPVRIDSDARPQKDSIQRKVMVDRLDGGMHEYLLYLPLYDGVRWLQIGVDSTATLTEPLSDSPQTDRRIVFYGTSIMQGGCASHPGMVATNILQRMLDVECVNLGFSGEGKMDYCMARAMATIPDVAAFVIDPVPNCTKDMCDTLTYTFINILRQARPDVPVVMVEGLNYAYADYSGYYSTYLPQKNEAFRRNYLRLKSERPDNLYYVDNTGLYGPDNDGTVDGIHLTDLGFHYYALRLEPILRAILNREPVPQPETTAH